MSKADNKMDCREHVAERPLKTRDPGQTTVYGAVSPPTMI